MVPESSNSVVEHYQGLSFFFLTVSLSFVCWVLASHLCLMITRWLQQLQASHPHKIALSGVAKKGDISHLVFLSKTEQNFPRILPSRPPLRFHWPSLDHIPMPEPTTDKRNEITLIVWEWVWVGNTFREYMAIEGDSRSRNGFG